MNDTIKGDLAFELWRGPRARQVMRFALGPERFLDAFGADHRLRDHIGHLREIAHRLIHLAEVKQKDYQGSRGKLAHKRQPRPVPQHDGRADGDEAVMTQLDWEPEAPSASIGVSVSGGVVTLTGFVNKYSEKLAAEKAVKLARGVRGVANDLVVRLFSQLTNMDIVKTALRTLENDVRVPADKVIVTVSALFVGDRIVVEAADGNVTLSGHVSSMIEREEAERIARAAPGAARVDNHLIVTP